VGQVTGSKSTCGDVFSLLQGPHSSDFAPFPPQNFAARRAKHASAASIPTWYSMSLLQRRLKCWLKKTKFEKIERIHPQNKSSGYRKFPPIQSGSQVLWTGFLDTPWMYQGTSSRLGYMDSPGVRRTRAWTSVRGRLRDWSRGGPGPHPHRPHPCQQQRKKTRLQEHTLQRLPSVASSRRPVLG